MTSSAPRWLNDSERETFLSFMHMMVRVDAQLDHQLRTDAKLSHFDYTVLSRLSEEPERRLRMTALAETSRSSLPRLSQVVAKLEKQGYVTRQSDPNDGRMTLAVLTADGMKKVKATAPGHVEEVRTIIFDKLDADDVAELRRLSNKILEGLS